MNLGNDKAFILFVEFFGNFPTPKDISQSIYIYIYNVCEGKKREYSSKFWWEYSIFNMKSSILVIYLFI
jgi:hypothetical protein